MVERRSKTVYVELLDEGVEVWRPVSAALLPDGCFQLVGPVPEEETWAFQPDDVVLCTSRVLSGGDRVLAAIAKAGEALKLPEVISLLRSALEAPEVLVVAAGRFQRAVWDNQIVGDVSDDAWQVLRDLAYDLDYFVADPDQRGEDPSYYGPERAVEEIRSALATPSLRPEHP